MPKRVFWIGSSQSDIRKLPKAVRQRFGYALFLAQRGEKHANARPLKGFHGGSVLEAVEDFRGDTFRAVYTVRFAAALYVLHVFQKKSKRGIETPKKDIDLMKERLRHAEEHYQENFHG